MHKLLTILSLIGLPGLAVASGSMEQPSLIHHWVGPVALLVFILAYALVMAEEFTHLRKSKPVIFAAGVIWALVAWTVQGMEALPPTLRKWRYATTCWSTPS